MSDEISLSPPPITPSHWWADVLFIVFAQSILECARSVSQSAVLTFKLPGYLSHTVPHTEQGARRHVRFGQKTYAPQKGMSAIPPKAGMSRMLVSSPWMSKRSERPPPCMQTHARNSVGESCRAMMSSINCPIFSDSTFPGQHQRFAVAGGLQHVDFPVFGHGVWKEERQRQVYAIASPSEGAAGAGCCGAGCGCAG
jgi:hypothetical protein